MVKPISDEELQLKVRARHRLIGAIAFVVALVVVVPMVFDSTPRQEKSEISIQIPAPENAPPFDPKLAKAPLPSALDVKPTVPGQSANSVAKSTTEPVKSPLPAAAVVTPPPATAEKAIDSARQVEAKEPPDAAAAKAAKDDKFVVQLGVFANPENAKQVEAKLKENNIQYYTEVLKSPAGAVRVRAGPFVNREDAEEVRTQLKLAGLSGGVVIGE
jgi:DedD protein